MSAACFAEQRFFGLRIALGGRGVWGCCVAVLLAIPSGFVWGQSPTSDSVGSDALDVLVMARPGSDVLSRRKGRIEQWQGRTITMTIGSRSKEFDSDQLVALETEWSPEFTRAKKLKAAGQSRRAVELFVKAIKRESRPWAKRMMRAELMDVYLLLGEPASGVQEFRLILSGDPNSRFINRMPLPWENRLASVPGADDWMASDDSATRLLGASWSLTTPNREAAIEVLGDLAGDLDPRIRDLATTQLWRTRSRVNEKLVQHWEGIVESMDPESRAGALFVLSEAQQKVGRFDAAVLNLMKVVTLHERQSALVAASLKRISETARLAAADSSSLKGADPELFLAELQSRFPESVWAK
jgi:tetratricopeptide (TPR) repeat protein